MAGDGQITIKDIISEEALNWGETYAKNVDVAIQKNEDLLNAAKLLKVAYLKLKEVTDLDELSKGQTDAQVAASKAAKAYADRSVALANVDKERQAQLKNLLTVKNRLQNVNTETNKQLIEERTKLSASTRAIKKNLTAMGQLEQKRYIALKNVENLNAKRALGIKLSDKEQIELRQSTKEFNKYNEAFKVIKRGTGQFGDNVGNYPKAFGKIAGVVKNLIPVLGLAAGIKFGVDFLKESRDIAIKAKGVEFAYKRLGEEGEKAFEKVRVSTRGLLSDLDLKTALVEFDNFNISLEETDTLFEFLAVRAAQTGQSIENLQSSLVEGLSKESKLRIDNLGISTQQLNAELEKTPDFVQAVANIAKREVAEAGSILDDAGNSQSKWNAALQDFQVRIGGGVFSKITDGIYEFGTNILRAIAPTEKLSNAIAKEQLELNSLATSVLKANEGTEEREILMGELIDKYPFLNQFIKDEKVNNDELKTALGKVNDLYIKRIAINRLEQKLNVEGKTKKLAVTQAQLALNTKRYQDLLTGTNLKFLDGDTNRLTGSLEKQTNAIIRQLSFEASQRSQRKAQGVATKAEIANISKFENQIEKLRKAQRQLSNSNSNFGFASDALSEVQAEVKELEDALGLTKEQLEDSFSGEGVTITVNLKDLEEKRKKANEKAKELAKQRLEDEFNLEKLRLQQNINTENEILKDSKRSIGDRLLANKDFVDESEKLLKLEKDRAILLAGNRTDEIKRIEIQYSDDYNNIIRSREDNVRLILADGFAQAKQRIADEKRLHEENVQNRIANLKSVLDLELAREDLSAAEKQEKIRENEQAILDIKREVAEQIIQVQINQLQKERKILEDSFLRRKILGQTTIAYETQHFENIKSLKEQEYLLTTSLSDAATENTIANINKQAEADQKLIDIKRENVQEASRVIADSLGIDQANLENFINGISEGFDSALEGIQAGFAVLTDVVGSIYSANIEKIDEQITASEDFYNRQFELAEGDKNQQDLIREEQELKRQELEKKKRKEKIKQAKFEKAAAIVQIGINTAVAITQALAQLGPIAGGIAAAFIGALGIAQIAIVASKPIPKYAKGTENHPGGPALVGEVRPEVIKEPGKDPYIVSHPSVLNLARGTEVIPSVDKFNALNRAAMLSSFDMQDEKLNSYNSAVVFNTSYDKLTQEMKRNTEAVENLKLKVTVAQQKAPDYNYGNYKNNQTNWS